MLQTVQSVLKNSWDQLYRPAMEVLPNVIASLAIVGIGVLLASAAGRAACRLFRAAQVDRHAQRLGIAASLESVGILSASGLLARSLQVLVVFLALLLALYSFNAPLASDLALRFFLYLPHLIVATVILALGALVGRFLSTSVRIAAVNAEIPAARFLAGLTRVAVLMVSVAIALEHLGIGRATALVAFSIVFGGATLAAAIALGLGSKDLVRRWLDEAFGAKRHLEKRHTIQHW